jgi:hypothetical protein
MLLDDDVVTDREAEPSSFSGRLGREERSARPERDHNPAQRIWCARASCNPNKWRKASRRRPSSHDYPS